MCLPPRRAEVTLKLMEAQGLEGVISDAGEESPTGAGTPGISITHEGNTTDLAREVDAPSSRLTVVIESHVLRFWRVGSITRRRVHLLRYIRQICAHHSRRCRET